MSDQTKVTVSAGELAAAADKNIILTKRAVIVKASSLFSRLVPEINEILGSVVLPDKQVSSCVPKISKGENYRGFPYVILDHPASFKKGDIFAVRTMFLWGHYFSIHLHLSGIYKSKFEEQLMKNLFHHPDFYIALGEKEWEHHFEESNYIAYAALSNTQLKNIRQNEFLKVALKYELHHWNMMQSILPEGYKK